ncbi:hypothetical protein FRC08_017688 [Ceratobasidium sp. 394]|nr:hypothetical protein FRC08_017688 [Ceratobasidium sp. 394]
MVRKHPGTKASMTDEEPEKEVYPNEDGMQMLPDMLEGDLSMSRQKQPFQRFFTCSSVAYGGRQPSYTHIAERMVQEPGSVISPERIPDGVTILRDMKHWSRAELNAWTRLIDGTQWELLPWNRCFGWLEPPSGSAGVIRDILTTPVAGSKINWTARELVFGEQMKLKANKPSGAQVALHLPPAQTSHIYVPYSVDLYCALASIHSAYNSFLALMKEIALMEQEGPVHNEVGFSDHGAGGNQHVPSSNDLALSGKLHPAPWLVS